ncbi:MAG: glycine/sarcosine/betaine reductase selenoprotein B family protein [Desulfuromonadaceae bacterium]|nr:glycine/sarcosine/betaine reductase selenoprotein B family protein [Desulfuromonadaceae bacterium]
MARLDRMPEDERKHILALPCPAFDSAPWVNSQPLTNIRIALITTAGLHRRGDVPFGVGAADYRVIPAGIPANELVMSHISTNFDRSGFQQDWNVVFPLDRLRELAEEKIIGSVAGYHYSFMGATDPVKMERAARGLAGILKNDRVDAVLLVPV